MCFWHCMLFPTFLETINSGNKKYIYFFLEIHLVFSSCFLYARSISNINFVFFGNIEKCPFTYWLNGRWFLQVVDIGNFNM